MRFLDRVDAGRRLGEALENLRDEDLVVLGLPRGGVPVAREIATALGAPLDVIVVRKLGVPFHPELAMGAIGEDGVRVVNDSLLRYAGITPEEWIDVERRERTELDRRLRLLRGGRPRVPLEGRTAVIVDDGIATGSTARAACAVARARGARRVVVAAPVASPSSIEELRDVADSVVCLEAPAAFRSVGEFYADFSATSDEEVTRHLEEAWAAPAGRPGQGPRWAARLATRDEHVEVAAGPVVLGGHLSVPEGARGIVVFAHGSGSSRHSPRNRYVARAFNEAGLGTLLFDLLTPAEEGEASRVFDVQLLADRLVDATAWLRRDRDLSELPVAYFGASTGAAAALLAAAELGADIAAVVSRGGRPDLAAPRLGEVSAPTLLVVGGSDEVVLDLNRRALALLRCEARLSVVAGASHLFEEPGALEAVAQLAGDWFRDHFVAQRDPALH
ncbi:MAG TPA: phosphoribosyltransferase family protein [Acidimicrobiia bacterium]|nr:phosphoribosyltransferase family protein [Acidimicrobiia bacterium]